MPDTPSPCDVMDHLARRYSVGPKYLALPAPSEAELLRACRVALRAPDHGGLRPFRFVAIAAEQRERLGELFAADAQSRGRNEVEVEQARARAHNGPGLVALIGRVQPEVEDVPELEQWLAVGAGLMNFLNALHLMGYGAKVLSGLSVQAPQVQSAFCAPGEQLLSWIVVGTPTRSTHPKHEDNETEIFSHWPG